MIKPCEALEPLQRVGFVTAGPDGEVGELPGKDLGEPFDAKSLAGIVSSKKQRDAAGLGFVAGVQTRFARDEHLAIVPDRHVEKFARAAAGDGDAANPRLQMPDDVKPANLEKLLEPRGELAKRLGT
jgi:hypothetical protein